LRNILAQIYFFKKHFLANAAADYMVKNLNGLSEFKPRPLQFLFTGRNSRQNLSPKLLHNKLARNKNSQVRKKNSRVRQKYERMQQKNERVRKKYSGVRKKNGRARL
jgi:hypothetical protein